MFRWFALLVSGSIPETVSPRCPENPEQLHPEVQLHVTNVLQSQSSKLCVLSLVVALGLGFFTPPCLEKLFFKAYCTFYSCHRLVEQFLRVDFSRNFSWWCLWESLCFSSWFSTWSPSVGKKQCRNHETHISWPKKHAEYKPDGTF